MNSLFVFALAIACVSATLPTSFDARTKWNNCAFFILNQESCGSCWDFCSVESFADRLCINGEAPSGTIISPQPILDCSGEACGGGYPSVAWNWLIKNGDTTCTRQCSSGCAPYDSGSGTEYRCHKGTCDSGSSWPKTYYGGSFKNVASTVSTIQTELMNNGPLQACFTVYNNFYTFFDSNPTGIYTRASGSVVGGHCVKLVGWGTQNGVDYWTFANSWDTTWADGGYFKMLRGSNLCGIEASVSEGFTPVQATKLGLVFGIDPAYQNSSFVVGGWQEQEEIGAEFIQTALRHATNLLSAKLGQFLEISAVNSVQTQVVAGMNFLFNVLVEDKVLEVRLYRNLENEHILKGFKYL